VVDDALDPLAPDLDLGPVAVIMVKPVGQR